MDTQKKFSTSLSVPNQVHLDPIQVLPKTQVRRSSHRRTVGVGSGHRVLLRTGRPVCGKYVVGFESLTRILGDAYSLNPVKEKVREYGFILLLVIEVLRFCNSFSKGNLSALTPLISQRFTVAPPVNGGPD